MARELGVFTLGNEYSDHFVRCQQFLLSTEEVDHALDLIEVSFSLVKRLPPRIFVEHGRVSPEAAIDELNRRFSEHSIGYQFIETQIVRVDSQYLHSEVVKPALSLLGGAGFDGPAQEFLEAHEHYRQRRYKEALVSALKAFESTMKSICVQRGWAFSEKSTANALIQVVFDNGLLPKYLDSELRAVRSLLASALPTTRNREGGHGQGTDPKKVPAHIAAFGLHSAAANIVLLVEANAATQ